MSKTWSIVIPASPAARDDPGPSPTGVDRSVVVFSTERLAAAYLAAADEPRADAVRTLNATELLRWLVDAHDRGATTLVIDPARPGQPTRTLCTWRLADAFACLGSRLEEELGRRRQPGSSPSDGPDVAALRARDPLLTRLHGLGIECRSMRRDILESAAATLCCLPMYMVAHAGQRVDPEDTRARRDRFGLGALREFFVIGQQEAAMEDRFEFEPGHLDALHQLVETGALNPAIYDAVLEALTLLFAYVDPPVAARGKRAIAQMIASVAEAAGDGWFGGAGAASSEQQAWIRRIRDTLSLDEDAPAGARLDQVLESDDADNPRE